MFVNIDDNDSTVYGMLSHPKVTFISCSFQGIISGNLAFDYYSSASYPEVDDRESGGGLDVPIVSNTAAQNPFNSVSVKYQNPRKYNINVAIPGFEYSLTSSLLNVVKNTCMPFYRPISPSMHYGYRNYSSINFQSESIKHNKFAVIYGDYSGDQYRLSSSFTFDFWVKPKRSIVRAGTLIHHSGNYAVSLLNDVQTNQDRLYLLFQFGRGTYYTPDNIPSTHVGVTVFSSSKRYLQYDRWTHVLARWSSVVNPMTGSIFFDGLKDSEFTMNTSSIFPLDGGTDSHQLVLGNFYNGEPGSMYNHDGTTRRCFLHSAMGTVEGFHYLSDDNNDPTIRDVVYDSIYTFNYPANAEMHEIRIWKAYLNASRFKSYIDRGLEDKFVTNSAKNHLAFYAPVLYAPRNHRKIIKANLNRGESQSTSGNTSNYFSDNNPFNAKLAFNTNCLKFNNSNYLIDFAAAKRHTQEGKKVKNYKFGQYGAPRLYNLTSTMLYNVSTTYFPPYFVNDLSENSDIYGGFNSIDYSVECGDVLDSRLILPNDNGGFMPNWDLFDVLDLTDRNTIITEDNGYYWSSSNNSRHVCRNNLDCFRNDLGAIDYSMISMRNLIIDYSPALNPEQGLITQINAENGISPYYPSRNSSDSYKPLGRYVAARQMSYDSIWSRIIMIPKIYYGDRIKPGTFKLTDDLSGSMNKIILADDSNGALYRYNEYSSAPYSWVGNIFYNEGIALVTNPHLYRISRRRIEIEFSGENSVYVHTLRLKIPDSRMSLPSSKIVYETENEFSKDSSAVIIDSINVHDKNYNIIYRARLAQPFRISENDPVMIKLKMDY